MISKPLHFRTTDNNCGKKLEDICREIPPEVKEEKLSAAYDALLRISNRNIEDLAKENPGLLVFPNSFEKTEDKIGDQTILSLCGSKIPAEATVQTGNLMGFIGFENVQFEISSRFTAQDPSAQGSGQDFFLYHMLEKVFALNLFDCKHLSGEGMLDFLIYLFPRFLEEALAQGMFREYRFFDRNDANVKGAIDVGRHIRANVPFAGRIAYRSRERSFDNAVTELVRHTIEVIRTRPNGNTILSREETRRNISQITEATPTYHAQDRRRILAQNAKTFAHPFFTKWNPLQKLCLAILQNQSLRYGDSQSEIYGILFDGAWLFEEYLARVLKDSGFIHPQNRNRTGGLQFFAKPSDEETFDKNFRKIYPDFYREGEIILDAKYKRLEKGLCRADLYQIVSYMHTMSSWDKVLDGGFIFPRGKSDPPQNRKYCLSGLGGNIHVIGLDIPPAKDFSEFRKEISEAEKKLVATVVEKDFPLH